jgi:hypothetical protein
LERKIFLRAHPTEGLVSSVLRLLGAELPAPDYSTLSRRARRLRLSLAPARAGRIRHLVIDSTGLKLYGEGEWKVRLRGADKRRTWRKLHLAVDAETHRVAAALVTAEEVVDPRALPRLLKQIESPVGRVYADGAYDARGCCEAIRAEGARAAIPPRKGSTLWGDEYLRDRNANLRGALKHGAAGWKRRAGYHRRSLAETAVFRIKALFSDRLRSREVERQRAEVMARCAAMNRMSELGMPRSYVA